MAQVRCPFCHEYVPDDDLPAHRAEHLELLPDGQHREYASLPPEEREQRSLEGLPRVEPVEFVAFFEQDLGGGYCSIDLSAFNWNRRRKAALSSSCDGGGSRSSG